MNIFKKYPKLMRPLILLGLVTGVYSLIIVVLIIKDQLDDFINAHHEAVDYIKKGVIND